MQSVNDNQVICNAIIEEDEEESPLPRQKAPDPKLVISNKSHEQQQNNFSLVTRSTRQTPALSGNNFLGENKTSTNNCQNPTVVVSRGIKRQSMALSMLPGLSGSQNPNGSLVNNDFSINNSMPKRTSWPNTDTTTGGLRRGS